MAVLRDRALLLRRSPFGESSLVVQALTRNHGRVHLIAKGAYRQTSRFFCVLDLFHTLDLEWSHVAGRDLDTLRAGGLGVRRRRVALDLTHYRTGLTMLELTDVAARAGQPDRELFESTARGLDALEHARLGSGASGETGAARRALVVFEAELLANLGLAPALVHCAACGRPARPVTDESAQGEFAPGAGGRLCPNCAREARATGRRVGTVPLVVLAAAERIAQEGAVAAADAPPELLERVSDLLERFLDYHLESRPRSLQHSLAARH